MPVPADKYDEIRRKWIDRHKYIFTFQDRRAQILARQIPDRDTERSGARVDPAADDVIYPFLFFQGRTAWDVVVIGLAAILAPVGWIAGRIIYKAVVQLIPSQLRSYPIAALAWSAVPVGVALLLLYQPRTDGGLVDSLIWTVLVPWLVAQVPAAPLAASVYGILEGWLAIPGSRDLWPMRPPPQLDDDVDFGFQPGDLTRPGIFPIHREDPEGDPSPTERP